jgi:hypothetical protein
VDIRSFDSSEAALEPHVIPSEILALRCLVIEWENTAFSVSRDREDAIYENRCEFFILEVMSKELARLEVVESRCPLRCVKGWKNLKSLVWEVPSRDCKYENGERDTACVLEEFRDFGTKPDVVVRYIEWDDEENEGHPPRLTEAEILEMQEGL